jgi:hypothetical protein
MSDPIPPLNAHLRLIKDMDVLINDMQAHVVKLLAGVDKALVAPIRKAQNRPVKVPGANGNMQMEHVFYNIYRNAYYESACQNGYQEPQRNPACRIGMQRRLRGCAADVAALLPR